MMRWVQYESEQNLQERLSAQTVEDESVGETLMILSPASSDEDEPLVMFGIWPAEREPLTVGNE